VLALGDTEEDGAIEGGEEGLEVIDGNAEVVGALLFLNVGEELGVVLLDGASKATTTMTIGSVPILPQWQTSGRGETSFFVVSTMEEVDQ